MITYRIEASPAGGRYWFIRLPDLGQVTQARSVAEIEFMARDLIALLLEQRPDSFNVDINLVLPEEVTSDLERAAQLRISAAREQKEAAARVRHAARTLRNAGLTLKDIGAVLGVSVQRAKQLSDEPQA